VQGHREAVQMSNVERAKVGMEGIVQKTVVNGKVHWRIALGSSSLDSWGASGAGPRGALAGSFGSVLLRIRERSVRIGGMGVGC
jgi:hypothetical protein